MRIPVNYLYFGGFFALLLLTITTSVFLKESLDGSRMFFWFYAMCQMALEIGLFILSGYLIERFLGRAAFWLFIGSTFLFAILHVFDFLLDLVLDLSVWDALKAFVFDESFENFLFLLDASGVPLWAWGLFFGALLFVPLFGMLLYRATHWVAARKALHMRLDVLCQGLLCLPAALLFWDYSASRMIQPSAYTEFTKTLPWKRTFFKPATVQLKLPGRLHAPKSEEELTQSIQAFAPIAGKKPSIFLFVAESLREDFITPEIAPHLSSFRDANISGKLSLSNANGTQISWFSIFHSQFPFSWSRVNREQRAMGSPALALFKQLGYKIHVYTSAELGYYGMQSLLFGKEAHLLQSFKTFHQPPPAPVFESDQAAVATLRADLASDPSLNDGHLFIVFLDATHFGYSWPEEVSSIFQPFAKDFAYVKSLYSRKTVELIRNRYRNAIHYIDSLFGQFLQSAPEGALVAFTGDHGEEFLDHGHLFHGSHLTHEQMSVPIYMKVGTVQRRVELLSQMDIFPTLLDGACGISAPFLEGESALRERLWPFVATARFNASRPPREFSLRSTTAKLIARFDDAGTIFQANELQLLSLKDCRDKSQSECEQATQEWIHREFGPAFQRLFH